MSSSTHTVHPSQVLESLNSSVILLVGPSGAGKGSIANLLRHHYPEFGHTVSLTSRKPRLGDTEGVTYYFVSESEFDERIQGGDLVEYVEFAGNKYGTLRSELMKDGVVLAELEVLGAQYLKKTYPDNVLAIFIAPPSLEVLRERLEARGTESNVELERRLKTAQTELLSQNDFDSLIVNDNLHETYQKVEQEVLKFLNRSGKVVERVD